MKTIKSILLDNVNLLIMAICIYSANTRCFYIMHQSDKPRELKKLRRF